MTLKQKCGLFENPYFAGDVNNVILAKEHLEEAKRSAIDSMVLLKNDDCLPLSKKTKVALIGPLADAPWEQIGCWAMDVDGNDSISVKQAFEDSDFDCSYHQGLSAARSIDTQGFEDAAKIAEQADVAVLILGEDAILSGESHSRSFIDLPGAQEELIDTIAKTGTKIVLVVMSGRPLTLGKSLDQVDSLLWAWHPGTMAGPAIVDLVSGVANPSGKLSISFPYTVGQIPTYYSIKNTGRPAKGFNKGIPAGTPLDPIGFVSCYLDADYRAQFPFGYGLSYSSINYGPVELQKDQYNRTDTITVSCTIENASDRETKEIVQLYIRDHFASVIRPIRELKDFCKVVLQPRETQKVTFKLPTSSLAFHDREMNFSVEAGEYSLWISKDSVSGEPKSFYVQR